MNDLKQYWQDVRALEQTLPAFVWLMSLEEPERGMVGGRMAEVGAAQAAPLLYNRSHRMATEEEIAAHLEQENQARKRSFQEGLRRKGIAVVEVPLTETTLADGKRATTRRR